MALGTRTPWKWRLVDSGSSFVEHDPDLVADLDLDARCGHDAVVGPRLDDLAGLDLPVDDLRRQVELLGAVGQHLGRQWLTTVALCLGREGVGDCLHGAVHGLRVHGRGRRRGT